MVCAAKDPRSHTGYRNSKMRPMSAQNAKSLIAALKNNDALKAKFKNAGAAGFEALAAKEGSACTLAEFQAALKEAARTVQLSEADLDKVAGGAVVVVSVLVV
jgi:ribonuclease D